MSSFNGVGSSDLATPDKQDGLQKMIEVHMRITHAVMTKHDWVDPCYYYIDAYCGDGAKHAGVSSSPVVFVKSLKLQLIDNAKIWFIDNNQGNIDALKGRFTKPIPPYVNVVCADSTVYVPQIAKQNIKSNSFGLLYIDPNGAPDLEMLQNCSKIMPRIDFLIRMNSTAGKRCPVKRRVSDVMKSANKKVWLIRRVLDGDVWQWTFLFGTNYTDMSSWEKAGFYRVDSQEGQKILEYVEYTAKEKKEMGEKLLINNIFEEAL